jgi:putative sigma-54 modulation protein
LSYTGTGTVIVEDFPAWTRKIPSDAILPGEKQFFSEEVNMTIEVEIYGHDMDVRDDVHEHATKKVSKLDRYLSGIEQARVDLEYVKSARSAADRQVAQITVHGKGFILRAEEKSDSIVTALDAAVDKIQRRIERYKGKHTRSERRQAGEATSAVLVNEGNEDVDSESFMPVISRRKQFVLVPMDEAEALEQMTLLGHNNFFVFFNVKTNTVNVLYRRSDATYGLIETEMG